MKTQYMLQKYQKKWVALSPDRSKVINSSSSFKTLAQKLKDIKDKNTIVTYVLPFDGFYSPYANSDL